jgi:hypothetical protein
VRKEKEIQCLVYYFRKTLPDAEKIYLKVEKIALALVTVFKTLRLYF